MSALEELYLVLAAIYLADCLVWVRTQASVFTKRWKRYRRADGGALWGNAQAGLNLGWPLPPLGCIFVAEPLPCALAPEGLCALDTRRVLDWEAARALECVGRELRVDGACWVRTSSSRSAARLWSELRRLAALEPAARARALAEFAAARFDERAIPARFERMRPERARLLPWNNALFLYAFVVLPLVVSNVGLVPTLLATASGLVLLQLAAVVSFARAASRLYPGESGENRAAWIGIALSPPGAMRSADLLSRDWLADFDPLAVAALLLPRAEFEREAALRLRRVRHDVLAQDASAAAQAVLGAWRELELRLLEAALRRAGLDPEVLDAPPQALGEDCLSYCPRCQAQYLHAEGACEPCSGVVLRRLRRGR